MNISTVDQKTLTLAITREFDAPCEKVFKAWTDPGALKKWFGPPGVATQSASVDLRVGGVYQLTMVPSDGDPVIHHGRYRLIEPPHKLVFTWILEGQACEGSDGETAETLVTIVFHDLGSTTRVELIHEFLPSEKSKEGHTMGWNGSLDRLTVMLA